eukprot:4740675-Alexandrium_andersonii.AAC.1
MPTKGHVSPRNIPVSTFHDMASECGHVARMCKHPCHDIGGRLRAIARRVSLRIRGKVLEQDLGQQAIVLLCVLA